MKTTTDKNYPFLKGGGEMGELIRTYNWSKTAVGSIDTWPVSLRTAIGLILSSRFPMLIFWSKDLITFYNDAFRPSLGNDGKHPSSLGQRGEVSWAESWPVIGPMIHSIMTGGDPVWFEDQKLPIYREGKMDYAYWTYSFSPVRNDEGEIDGLLVTCAETTKAVESIQKLSESKEQQELAIEAAELGIWDLNPITGNFIANERLKEWFGLRPEEEIALPLALGAIDEAERDGVAAAINRAMEYDLGGRYEAEYAIVNPQTGKRRIVQAKGRAKFDEDKKPIQLNGTLRDVTEQMLNRKMLEESEARFRSLIEEAPVATCLFVGPEMRVEIINAMMVAAWGKDFSVINKPLIEALPELEGQPFMNLLANVYNTGETYQGIAAPVDLVIDGRRDTYYYDFTYKPLRNEAGKVWAIINVSINVTDRVLATKRLKESELFARSIIDNSPIAKIVFTGRNMVISTVNQNMMEMLGRNESIIGKPFMEAVPELLSTSLLDRLQYVYATGETFIQPEEKIVLIKAGQPHTGYYQYIYKALYNTIGDIYGIITTAIEITGQVEARKKIEDAEAVLAAALELAELATWNVDFTTGCVMYSPRMQGWLGMVQGELEWEGSSRVHERDRARIRTAILKAMEPGVGDFDEVYTIINQQSGQERIIHANGRTLYDAAGKAVSLSGTAQDVTIQKELQLALENEVQIRTEELAAAAEELRATNEELAGTNAQLTHSNEELAQYAYVASHDLQEPLRKIRLFASRLNPHERSPEVTQTLIEKIQSSTDRMSLLINDLLEFSRLLNSDSLMRPVALNDVIKHVLEDYELTIAEKGAEIQAGSLPVIEGVSLQMNQLFYNLVGNALKFVKSDQKPVIRISSRPATADETAHHIERPVKGMQYHRITVSDNGIGFEAKYLDQIFEVFKRLHGRTEFSGSGIGLAICRRIVQNHQGRIYGDAQPDNGASFHIILPEHQAAHEPSLPQDFIWQE